VSEIDAEVASARIPDVPGIVALVDRYARHGEILPRTQGEIYQTIRDWVVAKRMGKVVGCGSLVVLWDDLVEIRSLVVAPEFHGEGIGRRLITTLLEQATELGIPQAVALTRQTGFFFKMGFHQAPRETLPRKIWKDCIFCTKFAGCDEVAVVRALQAATVKPSQGDGLVQMTASVEPGSTPATR